MAEPADKGEAEGCPPSPAPSGGKGWVARDCSPGQGSLQLPRSTCLLASIRLCGQAAGPPFNSIQLGLPLGSASAPTASLTDGIRAIGVAQAQAAEWPAGPGPGPRVTHRAAVLLLETCFPGGPAVCCTHTPPAPFLPGQWSRVQTALSLSPRPAACWLCGLGKAPSPL